MQPLVQAPELPSTFTWMNVAKPLQFAGELKGRLVLLDFFAASSIHCRQVLADLRWLQEKYRHLPFVVIGVYAARFPAETTPAHVAGAIDRLGIRHPVVIDQRHRLWRSYDLNAWPSQVLVGGDGTIIGGISGDGHRTLLDHSVQRALEMGRRNGTLASSPPPLSEPPQTSAHESPLHFPGKLLVDEASRRLIILDSGNHRLLVTTFPDADGSLQVREIIGSGRAGLEEGTLSSASFRSPQGAALGGDGVLWVADTDNHAIRRIDFTRRSVHTVLGSGQRQFDPEAGKSGAAQALNSPWDVAVAGNRLYISQAGQHQLFAMNLMTGMAEVLAGTGRLDLRDGEAAGANLAQPAGMAFDRLNQRLYFADAGSSSVRFLDLKTRRISTLTGRGVLSFGDSAGALADGKAQLQYPVGLSLDPADGSLWVADTYNRKIKRIDLSQGTLAAVGNTQNSPLVEPLSAVPWGGGMLVADTHHLYRFCDGIWTPLRIEGI